jgi:hypothetical protein
MAASHELNFREVTNTGLKDDDEQDESGFAGSDQG